LLKTSSVSEYYIFIDDNTNELIGTLVISDQIKFEELPDQPIMKKWWEYMKDIMKTNPDNSPVSIPLEQVFYLA
jgi:L-rhamnose mutarotase